MDDQVKKTGAAEYHRLKTVAKGLGISTDGMNMEGLRAAIDSNGTDVTVSGELDRLRKDAISLGIEAENMSKDALVKAVQRKQIADRVRIEAEEREKLRQEHRLKQERAEIIAESESLGIAVELPEPCTELDLAKARRDLGLKKSQPKPSPETLAIEASKKGYYIFRNLEQKDVDISCNIGGKHRFDFIPDKIHCLPNYIVKYMRTRAVVPVYERVPVPNANGEGSFGEVTKQTGTRPRFTFEFLDEAPQEAEFGIVLDEALKAKLLQKELV